MIKMAFSMHMQRFMEEDARDHEMRLAARAAEERSRLFSTISNLDSTSANDRLQALINTIAALCEQPSPPTEGPGSVASVEGIIQWATSAISKVAVPAAVEAPCEDDVPEVQPPFSFEERCKIQGVVSKLSDLLGLP